MQLKKIINTNNKYNKDKALIVAYLLGDGDISQNQSISFINSDLKLIEEFKKSVNNVFPNTSISVIDST